MSHTSLATAHPSNLAEAARRSRSPRLDAQRRSELGQFFTPQPVAAFMASLFTPAREVRLLDPGAGVGSLSAAFVERALLWSPKPTAIHVTAFETDRKLLPSLRATLDACVRRSTQSATRLTFELHALDFIEATASSAIDVGHFSAVIMNPPYRKVAAESRERKLVSSTGVEVTNLYAAFVTLAIELLEPDGQLVAITPRSFCNGPYFRSFRRHLLANVALRRIHLFNRRDTAFGDDDVLQENLIFLADRGRADSGRIEVSTSDDVGAASGEAWRVAAPEVVVSTDPDQILRLPTCDADLRVLRAVAALSASLHDLGVSVSTGRVVDFRVRDALRAHDRPGYAPLIYPEACAASRVVWPPARPRKCTALATGPTTERLLVPPGRYVLVKRFSAKEERRRISAALYEPTVAPKRAVAFENHLNYFHRRGRGLPRAFALGLTAYLNSTVVDAYFRQESGHTQVNATDLRRLKYPSAEQLATLGRVLGDTASQVEIDAAVGELLSAT